MCSRVSSPSLIMTVGVPDDVRVLAGTSSSPRGGVGTGTGAYLSPWRYADHRSSYDDAGKKAGDMTNTKTHTSTLYPLNLGMQLMSWCISCPTLTGAYTCIRGSSRREPPLPAI